MIDTPKAVLEYNFSTVPFPLQASPTNNPTVAQLTLVATNSTGNTVELQGIGLVIPVGDGGNTLTADVSQIGPIPPDGWQQEATVPRDDGMELVFTPQSGSFSLDNAASLLFVFNNILVNTVPGTVTLTVIEGSSASNPSEPLNVTKFPSGWGAVEFSASPAIINAGDSTALSWNGPAGATYTLQFYTPQTGIVNVPASGAPALGNSGSYPGQSDPPLSLQQTTTFTLYVSENSEGQSYSAQEQVTVTVAPAAATITSFTVQPENAYTYGVEEDAIVPAPPSAQLAWTTENAVSCTLSGVPTLLEPNGSMQVAPSQSTSYTLTAQGNAGSSASKTINYSLTEVAAVDLTATIDDGTMIYAYFSINILPQSSVALSISWNGSTQDTFSLSNPTNATINTNHSFRADFDDQGGALSFSLQSSGGTPYTIGGLLYSDQ